MSPRVHLVPLANKLVLTMRLRRFRSGFTVLELLVTLAIIGLLLSLFVPAISVARQAAQRTQCQNNLKQIGLALVNYHETFETFPPGYVSRNVAAQDDDTLETGPGYAWSLLLLDYLDQSPLATTVAYNLDATDPVNSSAMGTVIPPFRCPTSDDATFDVTVGPSIYILGCSNYVGMYGLGDLRAAPGRPAGEGAFYRNSSTSTRSIGDGLSNTILLAERAAWHQSDRKSRPVAAHSTWFAAIPGVTRPAGLESLPLMSVGPASLVLGAVGMDTPGLEALRPNQTDYVAAFSSNHAGGLNAALADSSVRFLSDEIDATVLRMLAQINDGGVPGEF